MKELEIKGSIVGALRKKHSGFMSGEEISSAMGFSRASVWKYINKLRDEGYDIEASTHLGYRLISSPDKLYGYEIASGITTRAFGRKEIYHHETIPSTNDSAYAIAEGGAAEGALVIAESQTRGKGRMGREWVSPKGGGIYMSLVLRPDAETDEIPAITLIASSAIARALKKICRIDVGVKWPNDVLVDGKKLCGILTEIKAQTDRVEFLVLGIGLNVNTPADKLPPEGTSLKELLGREVNRLDLAKRILAEFEDVYSVFSRKGFRALRKECKKLSSVLGKRVKIEEHRRLITGLAVDIDEKGALIIEDSKGTHQRVFSGDVVLCR
jgi:BirA family transcriptional regulator, biotin operon repressor / biotin---[acetyl-CoA-carboxylase] ligase